MRFTLVSTVFNESKRLDRTIEDLKRQTIQPNEIIITDAGSNDGTLDMLQHWRENSVIPIIILQKERCNVAKGRNMAIQMASCELIVSMDFGCRFHPEWLESLVAPFEDENVNVVGGSFTVLEEEIDSPVGRADYIISKKYNINVNSEEFIPSSRSIAYRKEVFDTIGGYCEWLTLAADDLIFGMELKAKGYKVFVVDKPYVYWGRHKTHKGFINEAYRYGLGDGEGRIHIGRIVKYFYQILSPYAIILTLLSAFWSIFAFGSIHLILIVMLISFIPGLKPYIAFSKRWLSFRSSEYGFNVFLHGISLLFNVRIAFINGYIKGYLFSTDFQKKQAKLLWKRLKG